MNIVTTLESLENEARSTATVDDCPYPFSLKCFADRLAAIIAELRAQESIDVPAFLRQPVNRPLAMAVMFHSVYERLAPQFGYKTRPDTRRFDKDSPNGRLMIAVCGELIRDGASSGVTLDEADPVDGMAALAKGVAEGKWPHTMDARVWADEFNATLVKLGHQPHDTGWIISWFANAIMAGFDTANYHHARRQPRAAEPIAAPTIVVLCGSCRFRETFIENYARETDAGRIVLSVGRFLSQQEQDLAPAHKAALDELHKRKIDLADEVLVLNVGGYIGSSTRSEIDYAIAHGKPVRYLEQQ